MTEREKQLRRSDRLRIGLILALCLILAVPVVVAMAASPDPSASSAASADPSASASATTEPVQPAAPVAPAATPETENAPSATDGQKSDDDDDGDDDKSSRAGRGAITIAAISGSNLSLRTEDGWTRTIAVTPTTTITKGGQAIEVADLNVGDQIRFAQKRNADGTYTVTAIRVPVPKASGEVTAISGNTMTLKRRDTETKITLNGSTQYKVGDATGSKSDVRVGSKVTVQGTVSGDTFTALTVHVRPTVVAGEVTAKTANTVTLKQRDGSSVVVHVSADTKYRMRGAETPGLDDLAVGDVAWAAGLVRADGSLDANAVVKGRGKNKRDKNVQPQSSPATSAAPG
jgi:Domain of unknown function (DUF5666)